MISLLPDKKLENEMIKSKNISKPLLSALALVISALLAGCGGSGGGGGVDVGTGSVCAGAACVNLGTAANYVILDEATVTYTPTATVSSTAKVTGNIGISPAAASFITGFALNLPAGGAYSTSTLVSGKIYAPDYAAPTPASLTTAVADKNTAYTAAAGMATAGGGLAGGTPGDECPGAGALGGITLTPGVYNCTVLVSIGTGTAVTLSGAGVYVIKTTQGLTQAANTQVTLTNGALPENVFWQVAGAVAIEAGAHMEGVILTASNISLVTGATVKGRLLAATGVLMDGNTVTQP
jgi:Ice-binding-like